MGITMFAKDRKTGRFLIATNGGSVGKANSEYSHQRRYSVHRFKNFYVVIDGSSKRVNDVLSYLKFDSVTIPMTKRVFYEQVFYPYMHILVDEKYVKPDKNGCVSDFEGNIAIVGEDFAFDSDCEGKVHEVKCFAGCGKNGVAYAVGKYFYDKLDTDEFLLKMVKAEMSYSDKCAYPIVLIDPSTHELKKYYEDGRVETGMMEENWKHGN